MYNVWTVLPLTSGCWRQFFCHTSLTDPSLSLSSSTYLWKPRSLWHPNIKFLHLDWNPLLQTNQWASSSRPNNIKSKKHNHVQMCYFCIAPKQKRDLSLRSKLNCFQLVFLLIIFILVQKLILHFTCDSYSNRSQSTRHIGENYH